MRRASLLSALILFVSPSHAEEIASAYSDLDPAACTVYAQAVPDTEGEWSNSVCSGFRGYAVFVSDADGRSSLFYGFPPQGEDQPLWESFSAFNSAAPKIEWRVSGTSGAAVPFAAIHRFFVSDPEEFEKKTEVLVVEKVGQPKEREGCTVGLVLATGNAGANEMARRIADEQAHDFACGADQPTFIGQDAGLPEWSRAE